MLVEDVKLGKAVDGKVPIKLTRLDGVEFEGKLTVPVAVDVSRKLMLAAAVVVREEQAPLASEEGG